MHFGIIQINHKSVAAQIPDTEARGTLIFAWWMACICDAYSSLYYRHKPVLDDDDYDIDFYTADPQLSSDGAAPSPREQLEVRPKLLLKTKWALTKFLPVLSATPAYA